MANPELVEALEVVEGTVNLQPASYIIDLGDIPGEEAARVRDNGWDKAFFIGGHDLEKTDFYAALTVSMPLMGLQPESKLGTLPEDVREQIDDNMRKRVTGEADKEGVSQLPVLFARINERGGDIDIIVCTAGTTGEDYWNQAPAQMGDNEAVEDTSGLLVPRASEVAIHGLYGALYDASAEALGEAISDHYRGPER